ncbi:hypothetical protein ACFY3M_54960 [Streptomyces mirabilis]|uniref:hypothetical protein n=1 Tax=Streptomyces mirabilis TaxID=68239 RepID=UPI0036A4B202
MKEVVLRLTELLFPTVADVAVLSVDVNIATVRVDVQSTAAGVACPGCGTWSRRVHGSYLLRFPADVPSAGRSVVLRLRVRGSHAVRQDDLPSLHTLAVGIDRDRDAVIAGLTLPSNSGPVEGHVNRIKMLKRQMFSRAGFQLLRKRVLPA